MAINILQDVIDALRPGLVDKLAAHLGESGAATERSLSGILPSLLGAMIAKGSNASGAESLLGLISKAGPEGGLLDRLGDALSGETGAARLASQGGTFVQQLLGDHGKGLQDLISKFSGLKGDSVQGLMAMAAPILLGGLAKQAPSGGFSAQGLMGLLGTQKEHVLKMLPPGLGSVAGLLGLNAGEPTPARIPAAAPPPAPTPAADTDEPGSGRNLLWLLLLGALALLLALYGPRQCTARQAAPTAEAPASPGALALPNGETITVPPGSIGERLFQFLQGPEAAPQTFVFDNLNFESGGATLTPESLATVEAITAILGAFPTAQVRLEGYTDNTGGLAANQRISRQRAEAVAALLTQGGVTAERITTEGRGPDNPIADNATDEGRAQNRRIELTVTAK